MVLPLLLLLVFSLVPLLPVVRGSRLKPQLVVVGNLALTLGFIYALLIVVWVVIG